MDIYHVMKLAKLDLNEDESVHFSSELTKILEYIDMIQSADVSKIEGILDELDYDRLISNEDLNEKFYKDCRIDECKIDDTFDFEIVKSNAPSFEVQTAGLGSEDAVKESGFFVVPQVIE
ncbi:MAG: Asp-tRNA(Asn)/Glu-tRNA(Gln) amidotransferase subunit GatC [Candidatus Acidulodesulfobacterium sp.]